MALLPGTRIGPYEVSSLLGSGGMGEVYRARDSKLGRDVAIKVLPDEWAADAERLARFEREAQSLAALNHPHIAAIYGLEHRAIIMELVEGPTLADLLEASKAQGRGLALENALSIAVQIAGALEAAHEKGIVHRDLKPANVKVREDGTVKVLDLGLATAMPGADGRAIDPALSPTLTAGATQAGVVLGTAAYMSPEQASAKRVDTRADIWAFGVVLWEMLAGRALFDGETISHTLADVLRAPIDFARLPATTPAPIRALLARCLDRDVKMRLRDIGEARIVLHRYLNDPTAEANAAAPVTAARAPWISRAGWAVAALALVAAATLAAVHFREAAPPPASPVRFSVKFADPTAVPSSVAFSPDGRNIVVRTRRSGVWSVLRYALDSGEFREMPREEFGAGYFWSADSRNFYYGADNKLKKVGASGGPPQTLCDLPGRLWGGFTTADGRVVFGTQGSGLFQLSSGAVAAVPLTVFAPANTTHGFPAPLPDGRHFLFLRDAAGSEQSGIFVGSLDATPPQAPKRLLPDRSASAYAASDDPRTPDAGHLLFVRERTLMAQPFDARRLELTGDAVPIAQGVDPMQAFSASATGALAFSAVGELTRNLTWFDRQGKSIGAVGNPGGYDGLALSPDGSRAAVVQKEGAVSDIWLVDLGRNGTVRLTSGAGVKRSPVWTPDGDYVTYYSEGLRQILRKRATGFGSDEPLFTSETGSALPNGWSPDGRFLIFDTSGDRTGRDLWVLPADGLRPERKAQPFLTEPYNEALGQFSPDGRFVAYGSSASSRHEINVSSFPDPAAGTWSVAGGGSEQRWRRDGKELLYVTGDGRMMSVEVALTPTFKAGVPRPLFDAPFAEAGALNRYLWDMTPDGQRFLIITSANSAAGESVPALHVILNWQAWLKKQ